MKVLQIGCGGIGSYLIAEVCDAIEKGYIMQDLDIFVADADIVEAVQTTYQNFEVNDAGKNKAGVLAKRFSGYLVRAIQKRIERESQLKGFDLVILCVDNERARELVIKYCHKNNKEFIDLRATGRKVFAMPKGKSLQDNMRFVDKDDTKEYSCQDNADLQRGWLQKGNRIVAVIGCQMIMNLLRNHPNRIHNLII